MVDCYDPVEIENLTVKIKKINEKCKMPQKANEYAVGFDIFSCLDEEIELKPFDRVLVPTGFCMSMNSGFEAQIRPRSGLALKHGITILNSPGTVDPDYRGEVKIILINLGKETFTIEHEMRIAQMVIARTSRAFLIEVENLNDTERGTGGFGSTGVREVER